MATVDGMTVDRILEIVDALVISGSINQESGLLTLKTRGGQTLSAGTTDRTAEVIDKIYPVGSIYFSESSVNPGPKFGVGSWVAFGSGRIPMGVDTADAAINAPNKLAGSKKITAANMPAHTHEKGTIAASSAGAHTHEKGTISTASAGTHTHELGKSEAAGVGSTFKTGSTGADKTNSLQVGSSGAHTHTLSGYTASAGAHTHTMSGSTASTGSGTDYLPPVITCYMWKRVA